eukprot:TRINITY_DN54026_c0_g2_i1.p1 TRINITY_DN54026_c0_g2~~TRINITY_DN54026_c0_g2_i1.p1  ORF type:complete len:116 (-),score=0.70 TRINITY_DN54026_c0_g2_i1:325-672(-)
MLRLCSRHLAKGPLRLTQRKCAPEIPRGGIGNEIPVSARMTRPMQATWQERGYKFGDAWSDSSTRHLLYWGGHSVMFACISTYLAFIDVAWWFVATIGYLSFTNNQTPIPHNAEL